MRKTKTLAALGSLFVACVATRWFNHLDTSDAQLYAVVVRRWVWLERAGPD